MTQSPPLKNLKTRRIAIVLILSVLAGLIFSEILLGLNRSQILSERQYLNSQMSLYNGVKKPAQGVFGGRWTHLCIAELHLDASDIVKLGIPGLSNKIDSYSIADEYLLEDQYGLIFVDTNQRKIILLRTMLPTEISPIPTKAGTCLIYNKASLEIVDNSNGTGNDSSLIILSDTTQK